MHPVVVGFAVVAVGSDEKLMKFSSPPGLLSTALLWYDGYHIGKSLALIVGAEVTGRLSDVVFVHMSVRMMGMRWNSIILARAVPDVNVRYPTELAVAEMLVLLDHVVCTVGASL